MSRDPLTPEATEPIDGAAWVARLMSDEVTAGDHLACARWRAEAPGNEEDYQRARRAWRAGDALRPTSELKRHRSFAVPRPWIIAGAAALVAVIAFVPVKTTWEQRSRSFSAPIGGLTSIALKSHAEIKLNSNGYLTVIEKPNFTNVRLVRGEAFFEVETGHPRTFTVESGSARISVIGTGFEVSRLGQTTTVAVKHGTVRVSDIRGGDTVLLGSGKRVVVSADGSFQRLADIGPGDTAAWIRGELVFIDTPIGIVFDNLQNYTSKSIVLDSRIDQNDLISASFQSRDFDEVLQEIDLALPITIDQRTSGEIHVSAER
jgi:transmembrane sensor